MSEKEPRKPQMPRQEKREGQEIEPSDMFVYALDYDQTFAVHQVERPRDDGKGTYMASIKEEFDKPVHCRDYFWEGQLWQEKDGQYVHDTASSNSRRNLKELAENLAANLRRHMNPNATRPYKISPSPSEEIAERIKKESEVMSNVSNYHAAPLTPEELREFQEALRKIYERQ